MWVCTVKHGEIVKHCLGAIVLYRQRSNYTLHPGLARHCFHSEEIATVPCSQHSDRTFAASKVTVSDSQHEIVRYIETGPYSETEPRALQARNTIAIHTLPIRFSPIAKPFSVKMSTMDNPVPHVQSQIST